MERVLGIWLIRERLIKDRGPVREGGSPEVEAHLNLAKS